MMIYNWYDEFIKILLNAVESKSQIFSEIFVKYDDEEKVLENLEDFESKLQDYDFFLKFLDRSIISLQSHIYYKVLQENKQKLIHKAIAFFDFTHEIIMDKLKILDENNNR